MHFKSIFITQCSYILSWSMSQPNVSLEFLLKKGDLEKARTEYLLRQKLLNGVKGLFGFTILFSYFSKIQFNTSTSRTSKDPFCLM